MITVHSGWASDFSSLGLCPLLPTECTVEEQAGGLYQLKMTHPMDDTGRWWHLQEWNIIKAPAPMRETPLIGMNQSGTVTREIYRVNVNSRLRLRTKPSTSAGKIIGRYKSGTKVVKIGESGSWYQVIVQEGGATGWMYASYLSYVGQESQTVAGDTPGKIVQPRQTRDQLFRIVTVERDDANRRVYVTALHVFYDLSRRLIKGEYAPEDVAASAATAEIFGKTYREHEFSIYSNNTEKISGEYTGRSIASALLETDGIVQQSKARLVRDNFDVFLLSDEARDRSVEIRHGKNMLGAVLTVDVSDVATSIVPVGKDEEGNPLYLSGTPYVDAPNADEIPIPCEKQIEYDVRVGDGEDEFATEKEARAELERLANEEFMVNGVNGSTVGLDVDFIALENTRQYAQYAALQAVHLYDVVRVIAARSGIDAKVRVTGYVYNCLTRRFDSVTLGELYALNTMVSGYDIGAGTVSGTKIIAGSVGGDRIRNASIQYAKIAQAAIEQLSANAITALRAHINELVAGSVTTDQLYADLAVIAAAQITAANIDRANINWAEIATLNAQIAEIAEATIVKGEIKWAEIETLNARIASVAQAKIDNAKITSAQITDLEATVANIFSAEIGSADIGFAQIKDLVTQQAIITEGVGGQLYIARLAVTEANMVSLTVGELIVKGSDGRFYSFSVDENGNVTTELKEISNDDVADASIHGTQKLIGGSITAQVLNVEDIFADSAIIRQMIAANIDVATLFAREATIDQLNALDIRGNEYLRLLVGEKNTVYRQEEQPEGAEVNDLWIQPSTGYTWQYTAAEPLPELYLDGDGNLFYAYADGAEGYEYVIDDDGNLLYSGEGGQTVSADGELVNVLWVRVKDGDLSAAELKLTDEGIMGVVTGTQAWQDVQSAAEVTESQIAVLESQFTQRMDGFELSISETVGRDELRTYVRYEDGAVELGSSASRYTAQISDKGFVVLQDGEAMTSMVQNTVSAPVIEARRQFQLGGFALRIGAGGHLLLV